MSAAASANAAATIAAVAAAAAAQAQQDVKSPFLTKDMQNNLIPRMPGAAPPPTANVKHELYFPPQCYGPPFNQQAFQPTQQQLPASTQPPATSTPAATVIATNQ